MKYWLILAFVITSISLVQVSFADCLSLEQEDALIAMALSNNQSPSFLIDIFESSCNYSYSKGDLDIMIKNEIDNQTDWLENQIDVTGYLQSMSENMEVLINATGTLDEMERMIDDVEETLVIRIQDMQEEIDAEQLSENDVYDILKDYGQVNQESTTPWWGFPLFGLIAVISIVAWQIYSKKEQLPSFGKPKGWKDVGNPMQYSAPGRPKMPHEYEKLKKIKEQTIGKKPGNDIDDEKPPVTPAKSK